MRVDCHCDTALFLRERESLARLPEAHLDYEWLRAYLDLSFFAIFIHEQKYERREAPEFRLVLERLKKDLSGSRTWTCCSAGSSWPNLSSP